MAFPYGLPLVLVLLMRIYAFIRTPYGLPLVAKFPYFQQVGGAVCIIARALYKTRGADSAPRGFVLQ
jgi:hypothetical protein